MSESNEKQITESVDSKAVRKEQQEKEQKQAEKHSKALYTTRQTLKRNTTALFSAQYKMPRSPPLLCL